MKRFTVTIILAVLMTVALPQAAFAATSSKAITAGAIDVSAQSLTAGSSTATASANSTASDSVASAKSYDTCYKCTKAAIMAHRTTVKFPADKVPYDSLVEVINYLYTNNDAEAPVLRDRYGFDAFTLVKTYYSAKMNCTCVACADMSYFLTKNQVKLAEKKVKNIAKRAKAQGSAKKRIRYIHNYLTRNTAYATSNAKWAKISDTKASSAYGVLLKHRGYCHGYTVAFVRILKAAGVNKAGYKLVMAPETAGKGSHAITQISNKYFDVTWDDPMTASGNDRGTSAKNVYTYYNKTKSQMIRLGYTF